MTSSAGRSNSRRKGETAMRFENVEELSVQCMYYFKQNKWIKTAWPKQGGFRKGCNGSAGTHTSQKNNVLGHKSFDEHYVPEKDKKIRKLQKQSCHI